VHRYRTELSWDGSTGSGYDGYDRNHRVGAPPAGLALDLSADPTFLGDQSRLNPEQLVLAAASSCQLLSFLAVAARARLDVVAYADRAEAQMPEIASGPMWITRIDAHLTEVAHRECFVANSLRTEVLVNATFSWR
jgi:organic hydroperoxide reductase OsmC/OhrA